MIIRPLYTVLGGAAVGLVVAAAVYGAVSTLPSSAATSLTTPAATGAASAAATADGCAAGEELEHGVCVVHVERGDVRAAPSAGTEDRSAAEALGASAHKDRGSGSSSSGDHDSEPSDDVLAEAEHHAAGAEHAAEHAADDAEHATEHAAPSDR